MTTNRSPFACVGLLATIIALLFGGSSRASGQSLYPIYSFPSTDPGCRPGGNLIADSAGNFYGTGDETAYELSRPVAPSKVWTEAALYTIPYSYFTPSYFQGGVVSDAAGNLYGIGTGGAPPALGVVFELSPPAAGSGAWTETILHTFQGGLDDGANPSGGLVLDSAGNIYGVTAIGGSSEQEYQTCTSGCGVAYKLTPPATAGGEWTETILHRFLTKEGAISPLGTLLFDAKGNLYGAAQGQSGPHHFVGAAAYKLKAPATEDGSWNLEVLSDIGPMNGLTFHNGGRLYGTTGGGAYGNGSVFELVPSVVGGAWTANVLYNFDSSSHPDAYGPSSTVSFDKAGNLYGTSSGYCMPNCVLGPGALYELTPPASEGAAWTETILHVFSNSDEIGVPPTSGVFVAKDGILFGTTGGTANNCGVIYAAIP
jgi:hypothetical protein